MKKILILAVLISFLGTKTAKAGGPWTQPKGTGYYKLSEWWLQFDEHFTSSGLLDPNLTSKIFNTFFYMEYGLTDRLTGIFNPTLFSRNLMNNLVSSTTGDILIPGEALNAFGDIDLGLKYGLNKPGSAYPIALSLTLGIPTGRTGAGTLNNLQTGDGEFNQYLKFDIGHGFSIRNGNSGYFAVYTGFNNRTKGFSEEIRYGLESGLGLADQKLWLIGRLYGSESLKNGETAGANTTTSIFANNSEFTNAELEVSYNLTDRFGISASASTTFRGEIIAKANAFSVGVFFDTSK